MSVPFSVPPALADHPRYRLLELLGAGGMGAVYKAEHRRMERLVALKVMSPHLMTRPEMVERFHREVKAAALLTHPNIVTAHDADQAGDTHFLIMEFVEGVNLAQKVKQEGPLPIAAACSYIHQAALGLQHASERGMAHRDIKPHNLMLTPNGQVKILDFGLARFVSEAAPPTPGSDPAATAATAPIVDPPASITATGAVLGTADFIAPEQAANSRQIDSRADIYSLGCTLYYLLAGHPPFPDGTVFDKVMAHCERIPTPLRQLRREAPPALAKVLERMMAKEPSQRYQTPAEAAEALAPFLPESQPSRRPSRSLARIFLLFVLLCLAGMFLSSKRIGCSPVMVKNESAPGEKIAPPAPAHLLPKPMHGPLPGEKSPKPDAADAKKARVQRRAIPGEGVPVKYRPAIDKGLAYLVRMQKNDGHWESDNGFKTAITAMAGMAMRMEGSTLEDGKYADSLRKCVDWLIDCSQPNGLLNDPKCNVDVGRELFGHGYSLLFLATVYGQEVEGERRQKLEKILTRAIGFSVEAQTSRGGWGYRAAANGADFDEGFSTIIQLQGLRAARNAGIVVPKRLIDINYLRKSTQPDGGIIYSLSTGTGGGRPSLTAAALACMLTVGEFDSDLARKWLQFCQQNIPLDKPEVRLGYDEFAHYYLAQALYILDDNGYRKLFPEAKPDERFTWTKYRQILFDYLLAHQSDDGSWNLRPTVDPLTTTILYLTLLQLDNATLPIYRRD